MAVLSQMQAKTNANKETDVELQSFEGTASNEENNFENGVDQLEEVEHAAPNSSKRKKKKTNKDYDEVDLIIDDNTVSSLAQLDEFSEIESSSDHVPEKEHHLYEEIEIATSENEDTMEYASHGTEEDKTEVDQFKDFKATPDDTVCDDDQIHMSDEEKKERETRMNTFTKGILLAVAYSASIGGVSTLVGTAPNLVLANQISVLFPNAPQLTFFRWFLFAFPLCFVFLIVLWVYFAFAYCRKPHLITVNIEGIRQRYLSLGKIVWPELIVMITFLMLVILW